MGQAGREPGVLFADGDEQGEGVGVQVDLGQSGDNAVDGLVIEPGHLLFGQPVAGELLLEPAPPGAFVSLEKGFADVAGLEGLSRDFAGESAREAGIGDPAAGQGVNHSGGVTDQH